MDIKSLTRNADVVHAALAETPDGQLIALKPCKVYIPSRFTERKLAVVSDEIRILALFAIVVDDKYYAVSSAPALMEIKPSSMTLTTIEGDEYYEFSFEKGACLCPSIDLLRDNTLPYFIYDEIIAKGHVPWYLSYTDLGKLMTDTAYHCDFVASASNAPIEMIAASITRDPKDYTRYYRHVIDSIAEETKKPPAFIAFRNIIYGATNTTAKLMGSYLDDGVLSALVNPSEKTEGVETLLRK